MTREEVMALTDEELRIRAAESLGLRVSVAADGGVSELGDGKTRHYRDAVIPDYPHDIAAAWELVQVAAERGLWVRVLGPFFKGQPYWAGFSPHMTTGWNGRMDYEEEGDTAPLAITRAFVLAMSTEVVGGNA